ncbi:hypothetical protein TNCV_39331 [Trichonephila clavipes]|nr:hypothetical protein TNCV_39331 [Trichonephila clavipes]
MISAPPLLRDLSEDPSVLAKIPSVDQQVEVQPHGGYGTIFSMNSAILNFNLLYVAYVYQLKHLKMVMQRQDAVVRKE